MAFLVWWWFFFLAEIDEYYADVRYERIAILNALGAYYSYLGKIETKQREKEEHFIAATQYYNRASRIDMHEPSTWVGKGDNDWDLFVVIHPINNVIRWLSQTQSNSCWQILYLAGLDFEFREVFSTIYWD